MRHKPSITKPVTYIVNGEERSADALLTSAPKPKTKPKKDAPAAFHKGFRVEGHAPGAVERAHASNKKAWRYWNNQTPEERMAALREGRRPPEMWDEARWRLNAKKSTVRARPFEVASAADQCAELARKAGWTDVTVVALKAGTSAGMLFGEDA